MPHSTNPSLSRLSLCLALLFTVALALEGCKKEKADPVYRPEYLPQAFRDLIIFQPGTSWVFVDTATGRVDSHYVTRLDTGWARNLPDKGDRQTFDLKVGASRGWGWSLYNQFYGAQCFRGTSHGGEDFFFAWNSPNEVLAADGHDTTILKVLALDSLDLPFGKISGPIYKITCTPNAATASLFATFWLAPHYGIVRQKYELVWPYQPSIESDKYSGDWMLTKATIVQ